MDWEDRAWWCGSGEGGNPDASGNGNEGVAVSSLWNRRCLSVGSVHTHSQPGIVLHLSHQPLHMGSAHKILLLDCTSIWMLHTQAHLCCFCDRLPALCLPNLWLFSIWLKGCGLYQW